MSFTHIDWCSSEGQYLDDDCNCPCLCEGNSEGKGIDDLTLCKKHPGCCETICCVTPHLYWEQHNKFIYGTTR